MWRGIPILIAALLVAGPVRAQSSRIELDANPAPIVAARINGQDVQLEVDLRLPDVLVLNPAAAERLNVRRIPVLAVGVAVDDSVSVRGRLARPRIVFSGGDTHALAGVFQVPASERADGLIGPGALPHDVITIRLGPERAGEREIAFTLREADDWVAASRVGDLDVRLRFDVAHPASVFNRTAARALDASGAIVSAGDLVSEHVLLGLTTLMQPVTTALTVEGLALGAARARTNEPLLGADDADVIVVTAQSDNVDPPGGSAWPRGFGRLLLDHAHTGDAAIGAALRVITPSEAGA